MWHLSTHSYLVDLFWWGSWRLMSKKPEKGHQLNLFLGLGHLNPVAFCLEWISSVIQPLQLETPNPIVPPVMRKVLMTTRFEHSHRLWVYRLLLGIFPPRSSFCSFLLSNWLPGDFWCLSALMGTLCVMLWERISEPMPMKASLPAQTNERVICMSLWAVFQGFSNVLTSHVSL